VLCQLSYAPGLRLEDCIGVPAGIPTPMSEYETDDRDDGGDEDDELLEAQEGKGYGEDEGEREEALEEE
jgi:hypothetical protein